MILYKTKHQDFLSETIQHKTADFDTIFQYSNIGFSQKKDFKLAAAGHYRGKVRAEVSRSQ